MMFSHIYQTSDLFGEVHGASSIPPGKRGPDDARPLQTRIKRAGQDDLEIVASPREVRPAGSSASKTGGRRIPMVGYALYAALAAAVSAGIAYMSIGGGEDGEEA